ncbi:HNH endonuclease [bacterium]|nr:HNH endonuclease [bacterium]
MEYNEHGRWNVATPIRHFGQWNKALEASGLKVLKRMNISDAELFDNLKKIWINKGRQPYISDVIKPYSQFDSSVYKRRFGNWRKALEAFVLNINRDSIEDFDNIFETNDSVQLDIDKKRNANLRLRFLVMKRDNFKCVKCGRSPATDSSIVLHIDHITPWSKGGKTTFENLQTLCSDCNLGKSDLLLDY